MIRSWLNRLNVHLRAPQGRRPRRVAARVRLRPRLEELENRLVPATITWMGGAAGIWSTVANWSTGTLPGAGDDVVIDGSVTVSHAVGSDTVNTLSLGAGAKLQVVGNSSA